MLSVIIIGSLLKLIMASIALLAVMFGLSWFDKRTKLSFTSWMKGATDETRAIYYGFRILAVCLLFGLVISG